MKEGDTDKKNRVIGMTSLETRSTSALIKRAEQLKRWQESDTAKESTSPRTSRLGKNRVQFTDGCVFLAACAAGDKDEVERLVAKGADIDTANVDGLTALHQVQSNACFINPKG